MKADAIPHSLMVTVLSSILGQPMLQVQLSYQKALKW